MLVRTATPDDAEAIRTIYNVEVVGSSVTFDLVPRTLDEQRAWQRARSGALTVVVAEDRGTVVGFGSLSAYRDRPGYRTSVEDSVYVDRAARGLGVGDALIARLVSDAKSHGFHAVFARIVGGHHASIALHRKHGFRVVGTEREVGRKFGRWLDVVLMEHLVTAGRPPPPVRPGAHPVLRFVRAFGLDDPGERRRLLEAVLAPEFRYVDPAQAGLVLGVGEMDRLIATQRDRDPQLDLRAGADPDTHHDVFRLTWRRTGRAGTVDGWFCGELDHTGRILRIDAFAALGTGPGPDATVAPPEPSSGGATGAQGVGRVGFEPT